MKVLTQTQIASLMKIHRLVVKFVSCLFIHNGSCNDIWCLCNRCGMCGTALCLLFSVGMTNTNNWSLSRPMTEYTGNTDLLNSKLQHKLTVHQNCNVFALLIITTSVFLTKIRYVHSSWFIMNVIFKNKFRKYSSKMFNSKIMVKVIPSINDRTSEQAVDEFLDSVIWWFNILYEYGLCHIENIDKSITHGPGTPLSLDSTSKCLLVCSLRSQFSYSIEKIAREVQWNHFLLFQW